jgi:hemolysin-activating ACP:hemolysin acyltransferase
MYFPDGQGDDPLRSAMLLRASQGLNATNDQISYLLATSARRQIYTLKSEKGEVIGYLSYALISKYTLRMLMDDPGLRLRLEELSEGRLLYVLDAAFAKQQFRSAVSMLAKRLRKSRVVCFSKGGKLRLLRRGKFSFKRASVSI